mmetsp:Transcript_2018/g.4555  ORF Transcript_2018/g.4555 Transcript_2018/m.4555 type:complete len:370 (+) Transcript_2018:126-1235(+)
MLISISLLLLIMLCCYSSAHVQLGYPQAIIDDDYQYTFDGSCQFETCDAFCGMEGSEKPAITILRPGTNELTLKVNLRHPPYQYRLSLSPTGYQNINNLQFDTNILLDHIPYPGRTIFNVTVDIPADVQCDPFCTIQLYDYYYFVSCAKVQILADDNASSVVDGNDDYKIIDGGPTSSMPGEGDKLEEIQFRQSINGNGLSVVLNASITLPSPSWLGVGLSEDGSMIGARAIVATNATTQEYQLGGKFIELFVEPSSGLSLASSSEITLSEETVDYVHHLSWTIPLSSDICGWKVIFAHGTATTAASNNTNATGVIVFRNHGPNNRGILGTIECPNDTTTPTINDASSASRFFYMWWAMGFVLVHLCYA